MITRICFRGQNLGNIIFETPCLNKMAFKHIFSAWWLRVYGVGLVIERLGASKTFDTREH